MAIELSGSTIKFPSALMRKELRDVWHDTAACARGEVSKTLAKHSNADMILQFKGSNSAIWQAVLWMVDAQSLFSVGLTNEAWAQFQRASDSLNQQESLDW